ncbi:D-alanyl-D-alanine carboxypeptidase family protein [Streptomyces sp. NRRL F-5755]|uniref:D-alanyl-D-alanine carboxypeptidase family protein n=1 Tax=Streptomyces sp. NRRL F-5755 TaxID=1519475 RepID=UPI001F1C1BD7|nr:D-alanyl-D-alanine carboxypeptidase [Streptomyces sp. NRRL F-5755]
MESSMGGGSIRRSAGALFRGAVSPAPAPTGTFTDVPTTSADHPTAAAPGNTRTVRRALTRTTAALAGTAVLLPPLLFAAPAHADEKPKDGKPQVPAPPAEMSKVGGDRLGQAGTQVQLKPGAPKLPSDLTARSWIVSDAESGKVLASHNAHWQLPPASTLKMLFADTVLPKFPKNQKYTVKPADLAGMGSGSSLVGIKENQSYTVHDLWLGVFLRSGNDAVHTLSAMNGGTAKTVQEMQKQAEALNATDTHVVTPDGYDAPGQVSSAYDLSLFARAGLQNADFREYCSTVSAQFPGEVKDGKRGSFGIQNTNRLLSGDYDVKPYPGIAGVKNGSTTNAGSTFTGVAQRGDRKLLVTVMNPEKKEHNEAYKETAKLFDWGFAAADKVEPVGRLVGPKSEEGDARAGGKLSGDKARGALEDSSGGAGGVWTAAAIAGGLLVVLGGVAFVVRRRWPRRGGSGK